MGVPTFNIAEINRCLRMSNDCITKKVLEILEQLQDNSIPLFIMHLRAYSAKTRINDNLYKQTRLIEEAITDIITLLLSSF